jgi:hypothetical protein
VARTSKQATAKHSRKKTWRTNEHEHTHGTIGTVHDALYQQQQQ